jgi:hypothetical protein
VPEVAKDVEETRFEVAEFRGTANGFDVMLGWARGAGQGSLAALVWFCRGNVVCRLFFTKRRSLPR